VTYAIVDLESKSLLGAVSLAIKQHSTGELGYWIGVPYWNSGYCTEAARALRDFAFDSLDLHRVEATHLVRNPASGRVMRKLGMQLEGIHRESVQKFDRFEDIAVYGILSNERG
jgi:RimJ/RimL family protein N-acetyltransferase